MRLRLNGIWLMAILISLLTSCASQKEIVYLQGIGDDYKEVIKDNYEVRIQPDDLISIVVNCRDLEIAQMFNLPTVGFSVGRTQSSQNTVLGYLVSKEGTIDFPILGELKIDGMTRVELSAFIKEKLVSSGLINDPIVTVQYLNFQVSVMGEVARPGTFSVSTDRITIFDALSNAGDMTIYGQRDNVKVIREYNGERTIASVDLRGSEILTSPYYYLQQNDVVYVEPNKARSGQREVNTNRSVGVFLSAVSVVLSVISIIF